MFTYTPVHLVESVENWTVYETVSKLHAGVTWKLGIENLLLRTRFVMMPAPGIMRNRSLPSLPLSCTSFNFYWLDEVNRSIVKFEAQWILNKRAFYWFIIFFISKWIFFFFFFKVNLDLEKKNQLGEFSPNFIFMVNLDPIVMEKRWTDGKSLPNNFVEKVNRGEDLRWKGSRCPLTSCISEAFSFLKRGLFSMFSEVLNLFPVRGNKSMTSSMVATLKQYYKV